MKNYLFLKYLTNCLREYIFIFLTATIFFYILDSKSFSQENVFIIDDVKIEGKVDINFSREKYINKAFIDSFSILKSRILLSKDLNKISQIKLKDLKFMINSFQILEENYRKDKYFATFKIFYNDKRVKKFLATKNISFSQPKSISAIFYPVFYLNDEIQSFRENYFYQQWNNIKIKNEVINFVMPIEDLDDFLKIKEKKNRIEELNVSDLVNKYDVENYVFVLMEYKNKNLSMYLKTMFNNNKTSKNIFYKIDKIRDDSKLNFILKDLKTQITDMWKEENIINLSMPLSIKVKFNYNNLIDLDKLKDALYKISIVDNYTLEEIDTNNSTFKIYYYGNPKKLSVELMRFGYKLENDQGNWALHKYQ